MAKEFTAESVAEQAAKKTQASKYGILNTMTVDQLRRAKKILNGKLKDSKGETKTKIEAMIGEYNRTERQIGKYYQTVTKHPKGTALLATRGKTLQNLTIQNIKGLKSINDKDLATMDKGILRKTVLGVGITMAALGAGHLGTEDLFLFKIIWKAISGAYGKNGVALAAIGAGGLLIGASFLGKKLKENKAKKDAMQAKVNEAENEAFEAASSEESKLMATAMSAEEKDRLINEVSKDPSLIRHYQKIISTGQDKDGNRYSIQQRKDYLSVLQGVDKANNELSGLVDEANKTAPTTQKKEAKQTAAGTSEKVGKDEIGKFDPTRKAAVEQTFNDLLGIKKGTYTKESLKEITANKDLFFKTIDEAVADGFDKTEAAQLKYKVTQRVKEIEEAVEKRASGADKEAKASSLNNFNKKMDEALKGKTAQEIEAMMNA